MKIEALPDDLIDDLLLPTKPVYVSDAEMVICPYCGYCEDPVHCVWAFQCPECFAPPSQQCTENNGTRMTGLHKARWEYAARNEAKV